MLQYEKAFTPEVLEVLQNMYFIESNGMYPFSKGNNPTRDKLKIVDLSSEKVYTADDFWKDEDGDFRYFTNSEEDTTDYLIPICIPDEVEDILNMVIDEKEVAEGKPAE